MPPPKVYTDDQVLKTFAERRAAIRDTAKGISTDTIQELLRLKQQSQTTINVNATPATSTGSPGSSAPTLPTLPTLSDLSPPNNFGLPAEASLRKRIALDQEITGYELLYLGDNDFLGTDKQAILLRLDLSVNNFAKATSRQISSWGAPQFVIVGFSVMAKAGKEDAYSATDVSVYTLEPEYTSVVSQESLLSSRVENYAAQATAPYQGMNLTGSGSYQRAVEQGLLSLVETPLQYAIYTNAPHQFAFALGPRRRINKRSWINPQRIFGDTYDIQYELEPGVRTAYALIALPKNMTDLRVVAYVHQQLASEELIQTDKVLQPLKAGIEAAENNARGNRSVQEDGKSLCRSDDPNCHSFDIRLRKTSTRPVLPEIVPDVLYTGVASQVFIMDTEPVTAETQVFIGSFQASNVFLLGRYRLKVLLPALNIAEDDTVPVFLVTPDRERRKVGEITLIAAPQQGSGHKGQGTGQQGAASADQQGQSSAGPQGQ
jgi:hypothetical protein